MVQQKNILTRGTETILSDVPINDGKLRFTSDTGRLFMDLEDKRIEITDFVKGLSEAEIKDIVAPLPKFYFAIDTHNILMHDGKEWIYCNSVVDSVKHATNADTATYAKTAENATSATNASTATYASDAASSAKATNADTATYAVKANTANSATKATNDTNGKQINTNYAPLASPIFTGEPTVPTPAEGTNNTQIANTAFVIAAITAAVAGISQFHTSVVDTLPSSGESGTIYFVPNSSTETNNSYDEYIWVNSKFEKIGSTKIDLSGYLNSVDITGTGNAITDASISGNKVIFTKGATFLTKHPSVTKSSSTATESPTAGGTMEVIDSVITDSFGHLTSYRKKTVTLPNSVNKATNADTATYAKAADNATSATNDSKGQEINSTYIKGATVSGKVITFTRGNGTTFTLTTQDTNTTYSNYKGATSAAAGSAGLVPAAAAGSQNKFLRGDGTWTDISNASTAAYATKAKNADTATYATNASTANYSKTAGSATNASTATYANNAGNATNADTSTYATSAGSATNASTAAYATKAKNADTATYASSAGSVVDEGDMDFGDLDE